MIAAEKETRAGAAALPREVNADFEAAEDTPTPVRPPRQPAEPRKFGFPSEVDLNGADGVSLKQFRAGKNPETEQWPIRILAVIGNLARPVSVIGEHAASLRLINRHFACAGTLHVHSVNCAVAPKAAAGIASRRTANR